MKDENTLNVMVFFHQSDAVTSAVALVLLAMSVACWCVMVYKLLRIRQYRLQIKCIEAFWHAKGLDDGLKAWPANAHGTNPFVQVVLAGQSAAQHRNTCTELAQQLDLNDWVSRCLHMQLDDSLSKLQSGMAVLASVGSTAPFVGLFGTVWGIYHALMSIGLAGQVGIDQVAAPIGEALIMTALGLVVAIPAVLGHNILVRQHKNIMHQLRRFAHDVHALWVTGNRVQPNPKVSA
jgi:biopolymer transport protein ExbB